VRMQSSCSVPTVAHEARRQKTDQILTESFNPVTAVHRKVTMTPQASEKESRTLPGSIEIDRGQENDHY